MSIFDIHNRMRLFRRGLFKYLVLKAIRDEPMHGYQIMKTISERYGGLYWPSPGLVYPTLQMLEDQKYVVGKKQDGRKVYSITTEGLKFLEEGRSKLEGVLKKRKNFLRKRGGVHAEFHKLAKTIFTNLPDLTPEKIEEVRVIIREATEKIEKII